VAGLRSAIELSHRPQPDTPEEEERKLLFR
jgi:hypothetical protein